MYIMIIIIKAFILNEKRRVKVPLKRHKTPATEINNLLAILKTISTRCLNMLLYIIDRIIIFLLQESNVQKNFFLFKKGNLYV